jgi:hypothetical protein
MNPLNVKLYECEMDADALVDKLRATAELAGRYDPHAKRRVTDMADWLEDVAEELAALAGHPRKTPDFYAETQR